MENHSYLIVKYFRRIGYTPYNFQKRTISNILDGKNVILQAPTGSGKTLSAIMPFLIAEGEGLDFPRKLIYSVPLRSLANKFVEDVKKDVKNFKRRNGDNIRVSIQTGERPNDEHFDKGDIVFTTYDQSLSSLLCIPIGLSRRQANVNAGAVASSFLVFDEIHLYEMERSLATTLTLLKWLGKYTRFLLMTATLTDSLKRNIKEFIGGDVVVVEVSEDELKDIPSQRDKRRSVVVEDSPLTPEIVRKKHSGGRTIVVCNTVRKAQVLYGGVKDMLPDKEIILLHSRFLSSDRTDKEEKIDEFFGKDKRNEKKEAILIATQVVEVGLDITCDTMLTEVAEAPAIIQRMGRCARFEGESGDVYVFDVDEETGKKSYLPYNSELCGNALLTLKEYNSRNLSYTDTLAIVDSVMGDYEEGKFEKVVEWNRDNIRDRALGLINHYDKSMYNELIRNIVSTNILICNKERLNVDFKPYSYVSFPIDRNLIRGFLRKAYKQKKDDVWIVKEVIENTTGDECESKYEFRDLDDNDIRYPPEFLIVNPMYVSYSKEIGLQFDPEGGYEDREYELIPKYKKERRRKDEYPKELYSEHINRCIEVSVRYREEVSWLYSQLAKDMGFYDIKDDLIDLMLFAHDLGKLDEEWQNAHERDEGEYIAHGKRKEGVRPKPHASVGAYVMGKVLPEYLRFKGVEDFVSVYRPLMSAIAKHHTVDIKEFGKFKINRNALSYLKEDNSSVFEWLIQRISEDFSQSDKIISTSILNLDSDDMRLLYLILSRILRLSDQSATEKLQGGS